MAKGIQQVSAFVHEKMLRTKKDFKLEFFCAGGPGGQHQNKTASAARVTCLKTGISAEGREFRSQLQNKSAAFERLIDKLLKHYKNLERKDKIKRFKANLAECRVYKENLQLAKDPKTGFSQDLRDTLEGDLISFIKERMLYEVQEKN